MTPSVFEQFVILWVVIDPIGTIPVFVAVTAGLERPALRRIAAQAALVAAIVLGFFLVLGQFLIDALGISLPAFQIAGGMILFLFALTMIFGTSQGSGAEMRERGEGRIIQNSSVLGFAAMKYRGAYNASKFAIEGWTDTLRLELHGSGIHVSLLQPGPIETEFRRNALVAFNRWINPTDSVHSQYYQQQQQRLENETSGNRFVLLPESCIEPVYHALTADSPKLRYRVTTPTKIFAVLKRLLPNRWLDPILRKAA